MHSVRFDENNAEKSIEIDWTVLATANRLCTENLKNFILLQEEVEAKCDLLTVWLSW